MECNTKYEKVIIQFSCILLLLCFMLNNTNGEHWQEKKWSLLYSARADVTLKNGGQQEWLEMQVC